MISACVVTLNRLEPFLKVFLESVENQLPLVKEVIIFNVEEDAEYNHQNEIGDKTIKYYGGKHSLFNISNPAGYCAQHALGLHMAIEKAAQKYVLLSDPDIFFYNSVDEIYLKLMEQYELNCIGVSHPNAINRAASFFPCPINLLVKKSDLPPKNYLQMELKLTKELTSEDPCFEDKLPGKYLFPGKPDSLNKLYNNPEGHYETGVNLCPWAIQNNWKWISFQTLNCTDYTTLNYRNNPRSNLKLKKQKLLYHATLSSGPHNRIVPFLENYESFQNID